jgi:hypothetical protein
VLVADLDGDLPGIAGRKPVPPDLRRRFGDLPLDFVQSGELIPTSLGGDSRGIPGRG